MYAGVGRLLTREVLVHGEPVNLRCTRGPDGGHAGSNAVLREPVEVLTELPEIEHAPAAVDWAGRVKDESVRGIAVRVDRGIEWFTCSAVAPASLMRIPTAMVPP